MDDALPISCCAGADRSREAKNCTNRISELKRFGPAGCRENEAMHKQRHGVI